MPPDDEQFDDKQRRLAIGMLIGFFAAAIFATFAIIRELGDQLTP